VIFAWNAPAQVNTNYSLPNVALVPTVTPSGTTLFASTAAPSPFPDPLASRGAAPDQTPTVYGVFPDYYWRAYLGYSFFRFYITSKPDITKNTNGLDLGIVYYPHLGWIGIEGQFVGEYGGLFNNSLKFGFGGGGVRFRWSAPRQAEVWGHVLVGGTKFIPQTAFGSQGAFAWEVGGGVDLGSHRSRFAIRAEADMIATFFFSTYQYSPRFAGGIVYKY
jgi:hypothetical protein